ncbi:MAG: ketol-acid reductoisomerase [Candidatus Wukongarchaeota archaeon]|nr:ketol-acid reductoisomerase [Candidatus Wukongarchaeota archaeon]MDO8129021.1 ketol-acid reductoisomerase [Candidatus Wukongarchaeota archaeon]
MSGEKKIWRDEDVDLKILSGKTIVVIGYGNQGRAQALNMRDSGLQVIIGAREGGKSWNQAKKEGFNVYPISEAVKKANIVQILIPDEVQPSVYESEIHKNLKDGAALGFSHAFNIHFKQIIPPKTVDIIMIAPKGPGRAVRSEYEEGRGIPALIAVAQDTTGNAKNIALAYSKAIGSTRRGVLETTFKEEVETDLFGEQVVLCGGVTELIKTGFETLVEAGYQPEVAYFECLNELKLIVDLIYEKGIEGMWQAVSNTAEYGGRTRGKRIITEATRTEMKKLLNDIQSGRFPEEWVSEYRDKQGENLNRLRKEEREHLIEQVGSRIRKLIGMEP